MSNVIRMTTARRVIEARYAHGDRERRLLALHVIMTEIIAAARSPVTDADLISHGFTRLEITDLSQGARIAAAETLAAAGGAMRAVAADGEEWR